MRYSRLLKINKIENTEQPGLINMYNRVRTTLGLGHTNQGLLMIKIVEYMLLI